MGRRCGWLALSAAIACGADYLFIPEQPAKTTWRDDMSAVIQNHRMLDKRKTIVLVAEGACDEDGNKIKVDDVAKALADPKRLGLDSRVTIPGHTQRGGEPAALDRIYGTLQAIEAVNAVLEAAPKTPTCLIGIKENKIVRMNLMEAIRETKKVADAINSKNFDLAMSLRDAEFSALWNAFKIMHFDAFDNSLNKKSPKGMRIGFIHVGAPAGGMNASVRAGVAYCLSRGHEAVAIYNGFGGFVRHHDDKPVGSVRKFNWLEVDGLAIQGGTELGTSRELPKAAGIDKVASLLQKYKINGLFITGGFEAFHALFQLRKAQDEFPQLCIPMAVLPATLSNNVPGTEYSVGSDVCLNQLVNYCDVHKVSASSTGRRVFVVETQGGKCGYAATMGALASGASAVHTPEDRIRLRDVISDADHMKAFFRKLPGAKNTGRLILVSDGVPELFHAASFGRLLKEECENMFTVRTVEPGWFLQGDTPSPVDRCRAVRLTIKCMEHLESFGVDARERVKADPLSSAVIGIRGGSVVFTSVEELADEEADWANRRPKTFHWDYVKDAVKMLSGRAME